jgi:hypothetical protein
VLIPICPPRMATVARLAALIRIRARMSPPGKMRCGKRLRGLVRGQVVRAARRLLPAKSG